MDNIDEILVKHFAGDASAEEEKLADTWRIENTAEYETLKKAWKNYDPSLTHINVNTEKAWDNVYKQTKQKTRIIPLFKRPSVKYSLAASLLLIIGLIVFLKSGSGSMKKDNLIFENLATTVKIIQLPDGSKVYMNQDAKLVYDSSVDSERKMSLSGEAFFEVKKDAEHPFVVASKYATITVLGTSFNINSLDSATIVSVKTGLVKLSAGNASVLLKVGESAFVDEVRISEVLKTDLNYLSWKTGEFVFENTPLPVIVNSLNTYYKDRFECDKPDCKITAHFKNNSVEEIAQTISLICDCKADQQGGKIQFR